MIFQGRPDGEVWVDGIPLARSSPFDLDSPADCYDLAVAILSNTIGYRRASAHNRAFALFIIAKLPREGWTLTEAQVLDWLDLRTESLLRRGAGHGW